MKEESNSIFTIDLDLFHYIVSFFPILIISIGIFFHYILGHNKEYSYFSTVSEMMVDLPESRIFAVGLCMEAMFFILYGFLRDRIFSNLISKTTKGKSIFLIIFRYLFRFFLIISIISMVIFSTNSVKTQQYLHNLSAFIYFISILLYFIIGDFISYLIDFKISILSFLLSFLPLFTFFIGIYLRKIKNNNSLSSILEIITILLISLKVFYLKFELPKTAIRVKKE